MSLNKRFISTEPATTKYADAINLNGSDEYLDFDPNACNRNTLTISVWFRTTETTDRGFMVSQGTDGNNFATAEIHQDGHIVVGSYVGSTIFSLKTTSTYNDGNWHHLVAAIDTGQATESNRVKIYLNGTQITAFDESTYPSYYRDLEFGRGTDVTVGRLPGFSTGFFNGDLALIYYINGFQYAPTKFGQTVGGQWVPATYTSSYGTCGWFLNFSNASSLGTDSSGQSNNFGLNNINSANQTEMAF